MSRQKCPACDALVAWSEDGKCPSCDASLCPTEVQISDLLENMLSPVPSDGPTELPPRPTHLQSSHIGAYNLLQEIGAGGFGVVFLAEQERPVRRRVALKIIKLGMDTRQVIARFEAERQALAIMDHQNIAKVLDAGETDDGRPYFAMELVQGIPFNQYCDKNKLSLKERLELFIPICRAVQHAHQKGIIHRDLKPTNVLVTLYAGRPVPKVIDFGLAKALQHQVRLTDRTLFTEFNQVLGTLQYMSPEQAEMNALDVDTRTDVYSLGVMLYELLTGSTPIEIETIRNHALLEVVRWISERETPRPSTRLSNSGDAIDGISRQRRIEPSKLQQILRGDLDWIAMKALEKDRTRRYETADAFATDIERFLNNEPVEARPPSVAYRLRKTIRKYRAAVLVFMLVLLLLVGGIAATTWQAVIANVEASRANAAEARSKADAAKAREAERQAKDEAQRVRKANELLAIQRKRAETREDQAIAAVANFRDAVANEPMLRNMPALDELRKRLLKEPMAFFRVLRDQLQLDRDTRPDALARLARTAFDLAHLVNEIGDTQDALIAFQESLAILAQLARENPSDLEVRRKLVRTHINVGVLLSQTGKAAEAMAAYEQALAIQEPLARDHPGIIENQDILATTHINVGNLLFETGKLDEALKAFQRSLAIQESLARDHPGVTEFQKNLGHVLNNIGVLLRVIGKSAEALAAHQQALAIREQLAQENPEVPDFQRDLAGSHKIIGSLLSETGEAAKGMAAHQQALAIREQLVQENPTVTNYQDDLSISHGDIGDLLNKTGKLAESMASYKQGLAIRERLARENPTITRLQSGLAASHSHIGGLLLKTGKSADALMAFQNALAIRERLAQENPTITHFQLELGASYHSIARVLYVTGKPDEALKAFQRSLAIHEQLARGNPTARGYQSDLAVCHNDIGNFLSETGKVDEALAAHQQALAIREQLARENPTITKYQNDLAGSHNNIGVLLRATGNPEQALAAWQRALAIREQLARENPSVTEYQSDLAATNNNIGVLLRAIGKSAEALAAHQQALVIHEELARGDPSVTQYQSDLAASQTNVGIVLSVTGKPAEALAAYQQALAIRQRLATDHPESPDFASDIGRTLDLLANLDLDAKRFVEARDRLLKAIEWQKKALAVNPRHSSYRQFLAHHYAELLATATGLSDSGLAAEAKQGLKEVQATDPQFVALNNRLGAILNGDRAQNNPERLMLALHAYNTERFVVAAQLWAEALESDPELAKSRQNQHAYNAACAAALAGCGQGNDDPPPDDAVKATLRKNARMWLSAELVLWRKLLDAADSRQRRAIAETLLHWQMDTDLAGVRDEEPLDKLPEDERKSWHAIWAEVANVLSDAQASRPDFR